MKLEKPNYYRLLYSDNGSWVKSTNGSFGTELIRSLVEQLNGVIEWQPGTNKSEYSIQLEVIDGSRL